MVGVEEEKTMGMASCLYRLNGTSLLALEEEEEEVVMVGVEEEKAIEMAQCLCRHNGTGLLA